MSLSALLSATALQGLTHTKIELVIDGDVPFPRLYAALAAGGFAVEAIDESRVLVSLSDSTSVEE